LGKFAIINTFGEQGPLGSYHLNLHDVAKGVYTVKVKTGLGIVFKKLVIQ
jgi:hypothetical protein